MTTECWYWPQLWLNTARYYARHRRPLAMLRALWTEIVLHDNGETCQDCGHRYLLWMAAADLYRRVHGNRGGTLCPSCFTGQAKTKGITILWQPHVVRDEDGDYWSALDEQIRPFDEVPNRD